MSTKLIITPEQLNFIVESSSSQNSLPSNYVNIFERVCNKILKKKFDWFKKIEVNSITISQSITRRTDLFYATIHGTIFVDSDWGYKSSKEYYYTSQVNDDMLFGDIIGNNTADEFKKYFKEFLKPLTNKEIVSVNISNINVIFVDMDN